MEFPARAQAIVLTLYENHRDLAEGDDDDRRQLTRMMAEQIAYELGPLWGTKSASPPGTPESQRRPQSKDAIAYNGGDQLVGWDWQLGTTREPLIPPTFHDLAGQMFLPVEPQDHLGHGEPDPRDSPDMDIDQRVQLVAANGKFVCAEQGGGLSARDRRDVLVANRDIAGAWETFTLEPQANGGVALRTSAGYYVTAEYGGGGALSSDRSDIGEWEIFRLVNGQFCCMNGTHYLRLREDATIDATGRLSALTFLVTPASP